MYQQGYMYSTPASSKPDLNQVAGRFKALNRRTGQQDNIYISLEDRPTQSIALLNNIGQPLARFSAPVNLKTQNTLTLLGFNYANDTNSTQPGRLINSQPAYRLGNRAVQIAKELSYLMGFKGQLNMPKPWPETDIEPSEDVLIAQLNAVTPDKKRLRLSTSQPLDFKPLNNRFWAERIKKNPLLFETQKRLCLGELTLP